MSFAGFTPKLKMGCLQPGAVIDNAPYEFYRLAPRDVMMVMVGVGLKILEAPTSSAYSRRSTSTSISSWIVASIW